MANWRLAKSLTQLRNQINAASPKRNKASDGTIGDAAHASRDSDHNPWFKDSKGVGVVSAMDITHDPAHAVDGNVLSRAVIADPRVKYVIFNARIWKARTGKWEPYRGPNAHRHHVHVSVKQESADLLSPWPWPTGVVNALSMASALPVAEKVLEAKPEPPVEAVASPVTQEEADKGLTTGSPTDTPKGGVQEPVKAVEVVASRPSLKSTAAAVLTFIMAPLSYFGIDVKQAGQAGAQFAANNVGLAIKVAVGFGFVVVAAYVWNRAMDRAQDRTNKIIDAAMDKDANNIRLVGPKEAKAAYQAGDWKKDGDSITPKPTETWKEAVNA